MRLIPFLRNSKIVFAEVSAKRIKIFVFSRARARFLEYIEVPFKDKTAVSRELSKIANQYKLKNASLYISVSQSIAINKYIDLPTTNEAEIPDLLKWQLPNFVFYPPEDILYSYKIINKTSSKSQLMLFLVLKHLIMPYLQAFAHAGFNIEKIILSSEIVAQWAREKAQSQGFRFPVCFINIDKHMGELSIIDKDGLIFSRGFNISDKEPSEQIAREVEISLDVYKKIPVARPIEQIFLLGGADIVKPIMSNIAGDMELQPRLLEVESREGFGPDTDVSMAIAKQFAVLNSLTFSMEFTPYDFLRKQESRNAIRDLAYTFALLVSLGIVGIYHISVQYMERQKLNAEIESRYKEIQSLSAKARKVQATADALKEMIPNGRILPVLEAVSVSKSKDIYIDLIVYKTGDSISVKGYAKELQGLLSFVEKLNKKQIFKNCEIKYAVKKEIKGEEQTSFEIFCKIANKKEGKNGED